MEISIGSYKVRLEILLLIVILLWIIFGHALCSCSTMSAKEGFAAISSAVSGTPIDTMKNKKKKSSSSKGGKGSKGGKEGFTSNNTSAFDTQFAQNNSNFSYMNPKDWSQQTLVYTPGIEPDAGVQTIWARSKNSKPPGVPPLDFYDGMPFKPQCCSNSDTSNSSGCACYSVADYNYLKTRAGNNVPYSDM